MTAKEQLFQEVEQASEALAEEVLNFLLFTKVRNRHGSLPADNRAETPVDSASAPQETGKSLLELFDAFIKDIPEEELAKLPKDGAEQHDHYIYGTPKRVL